MLLPLLHRLTTLQIFPLPAASPVAEKDATDNNFDSKFVVSKISTKYVCTNCAASLLYG